MISRSGQSNNIFFSPFTPLHFIISSFSSIFLFVFFKGRSWRNCLRREEEMQKRYRTSLLRFFGIILVQEVTIHYEIKKKKREKGRNILAGKGIIMKEERNREYLKDGRSRDLVSIDLQINHFFAVRQFSETKHLGKSQDLLSFLPRFLSFFFNTTEDHLIE